VNNTPLFTVATVSFNSDKWIKQTIDSVLASNFSDFEFLISDDNSSDDTWEIINKYSVNNLRVWRQNKNIGEYENRNFLLSQAQGKYILFVDGDDILYKSTLRNLSEYVNYFQDACMIWGLNPQHFNFFVFPYLVYPEMLINLIYRTLLPISVIGLGEILFKTESLRNLGGFNISFKISDTHIKKRLSIIGPVLFIPIGMMYWREHESQASKLFFKNRLKSLLERFTIDKDIIYTCRKIISEKDYSIIKENIAISYSKLLFKNTILRGDIYSFFKYKKSLKFKFKYLFKRGDYSYFPTKNMGTPFLNNFNFRVRD
jgi:glycosyltransferase involved in cell wall biosynthesis